MEPIDSNNPPDAGTPAPPIPAFVAVQPKLDQLIPWSHRLPLGLQLRYGMTAQGLVDRIQVLEKYGFVVVARHEPWYERVWCALRLRRG